MSSSRVRDSEYRVTSVKPSITVVITGSDGRVEVVITETYIDITKYRGNNYIDGSVTLTMEEFDKVIEVVAKYRRVINELSIRHNEERDNENKNVEKK